MTAQDHSQTLAWERPGWPEIAAGLITYALLLVLLGLWMLSVPDDQAALRGTAGLAANGAAGIVALAVAVLIRIRDLRPFGFRSANWKWLLIGAALGIVAYFVNLYVADIYARLFGEDNTQSDFLAAASSGMWMLIVIGLTGAILTPFGEEALFRAVVANGLNRYGPWAGVVASAAIFALAHGVNVIFPLAFVVGVLTAILFRQTGSIWPGVALHIVYNSLNLLRLSFM